MHAAATSGFVSEASANSVSGADGLVAARARARRRSAPRGCRRHRRRRRRRPARGRRRPRRRSLRAPPPHAITVVECRSFRNVRTQSAAIRLIQLIQFGPQSRIKWYEERPWPRTASTTATMRTSPSATAPLSRRAAAAAREAAVLEDLLDCARRLCDHGRRDGRGRDDDRRRRPAQPRAARHRALRDRVGPLAQYVPKRPQRARAAACRPSSETRSATAAATASTTNMPPTALANGPGLSGAHTSTWSASACVRPERVVADQDDAAAGLAEELDDLAGHARIGPEGEHEQAVAGMHVEQEVGERAPCRTRSAGRSGRAG